MSDRVFMVDEGTVTVKWRERSYGRQEHWEEEYTFTRSEAQELYEALGNALNL